MAGRQRPVVSVCRKGHDNIVPALSPITQSGESMGTGQGQWGSQRRGAWTRTGARALRSTLTKVRVLNGAVSNARLINTAGVRMQMQMCVCVCVCVCVC